MGAVRLISGQFGGRNLKSPSSDATHPMSERARAGIFNALVSSGFDFTDAKVLDLFAGSGALGFEALSRGAGQATFVEKSPYALTSLRENTELLGISSRAKIINQNVFSFTSDTTFNLIFCDPPYADFPKISRKLAELLGSLPTSPKAVLVISRPSSSESLALPNWQLTTSKTYADAHIDFYHR